METGVYATACSDTLGIRQKLTIEGGGGRLYVTDHSGQTITIDATAATVPAGSPAVPYVNVMTRDYELNKSAHSISNSSFAVVHQISTPLNFHDANGNSRYDSLWTGPNAKARMADYRKQFDARFYKRY